MKAVFDTNILIDYLNGVQMAADEIARYDERLISVISYIEVSVGASSEEEQDVVKSFLNTFRICGVTTKVAEEAIRLRKQYRLKVPDAIIYATARSESALIVSRDIKDFQSNWVDVRVPYKLES